MLTMLDTLDGIQSNNNNINSRLYVQVKEGQHLDDQMKKREDGELTRLKQDSRGWKAIPKEGIFNSEIECVCTSVYVVVGAVA